MLTHIQDKLQVLGWTAITIDFSFKAILKIVENGLRPDKAVEERCL